MQETPDCPAPVAHSEGTVLASIINFDVEDTINENIDASLSGLTNLGNGRLISSLLSYSPLKVARSFMEGVTKRMGVSSSFHSAGDGGLRSQLTTGLSR